MKLSRRRALAALAGAAGCVAWRPSSAQTAALAWAPAAPRGLARFAVGTPGVIDLAPWLLNVRPGTTQLRLRVNPVNQALRNEQVFVSLQSQCTEFSLTGLKLRFDGTNPPAIAPGAAAVRVQLEATNSSFDDPSAVVISDIKTIRIDAPKAFIKHGLDRWDSFAALAQAVQGAAPAGSTPAGRIDLIGGTFDITPGVMTEASSSASGEPDRPAPVAVLQFPCTVRALDARRRPVLLSISGERDIVLVQASLLPPIDGEVVLQDLVIRDNRAWYDSGEAGVRIKDKFAGRSVRVERCELLRCQNAVAGGSLGQTLKIIDCRIVDCGFGTQAHGLYVQPQWLEFHGNLVMQSPGNRLAQAHLLKCRAMNARIVGNHFVMNDCPGSYLIDLSNGGDVEIGGNLLHFGTASDNSGATLIAYAPEGASGDHPGGKALFAPGRDFRLMVRNNTLVSDFAGHTAFIVIDQRTAQRAEGGLVSTLPRPLVIADNLWHRRGSGALVLLRDRTRPTLIAQDDSLKYIDNTEFDTWSPVRVGKALGASGRDANSGGPYQARRFAGRNLLGTGSEPYTFMQRGSD